MKRWVFLATLLFVVMIVAIVLAADAGRIPKVLDRVSDFPGGDKAGHFLLFGVLSYLLNRSALLLFPRKGPVRVVLVVVLSLVVLIGLEEWSQSLFPARTMSLSDLLASYAGVALFALLAYRLRPR